MKKMRVFTGLALSMLLALTLIASTSGAALASHGKTQGVTWENGLVSRGNIQGVTWESVGVTWE